MKKVIWGLITYNLYADKKNCELNFYDKMLQKEDIWKNGWKLLVCAPRKMRPHVYLDYTTYLLTWFWPWNRAYYVNASLASRWWDFPLSNEILQPARHGIQQVLQLHTHKVSTLLVCTVFVLVSSIEFAAAWDFFCVCCLLYAVISMKGSYRVRPEYSRQTCPGSSSCEPIKVIVTPVWELTKMILVGRS